MDMSTTGITITQDGDTVSILDTFEIVTITSRQMKPGMILVDEFGLACAALDHRIGTGDGGQGVQWLIEDLESGRWTRSTFLVSRIPTIKVAGRKVS